MTPMKFLLISLVIVFSTNVYSQIGKSQIADKIIEVGSVERILGDYISVYSLSFLEKEGIKFYALAFTNERTLYDDNSPDQKILAFNATQDEFDYLYNFLLDGFEEEHIRYLEVGQDIIKTIPLTTKYLYVYVDYQDGTSASFKVSKWQLSKLFGKKRSKKKRRKKKSKTNK